MAFDKLMRALGFRSDDEDDGIEYPSALPVGPAVHCPQDTQGSGSDMSENIAETVVARQPEQPVEPDFPLTIFDGLLQVFNAAQPDFIRKCLDMDAQRRYLYDSIDSSFKEYIARYQADIRERARAEAEDASSMLHKELAQLRERCKEIDGLEEDKKRLRISSERQKRTFNDRIRDLEGKIGLAEAEKEQLQLEIKSLLNKVKVASVHEKDAKAYKADLDNLRRQQKGGGISLDEVVQLRESLEAANQRVTAMNAENVAREAEVVRLQKEIESLKRLVDEQNRATAEAADRIESSTNSVEADNAPGPDAATEQVKGKGRPSRRRKKKTKPSPAKISAIDETLDETEWLVATPPEGMVAKSVSIASDPDFGYQEPPRKQPPVNDAQMSLF